MNPLKETYYALFPQIQTDPRCLKHVCENTPRIKLKAQNIEFSGHSDMMIMFWALFYCVLLCLPPSLEQWTHKDSSSSNKIRDKSLTELNSSDEHILLCREHHSPTSLCLLPCFHCIMRVSLHLACQHLFYIDSRASGESAFNQKEWENKNTERIKGFTGFYHTNTAISKNVLKCIMFVL